MSALYHRQPLIGAQLTIKIRVGHECGLYNCSGQWLYIAPNKHS